MKYLIAVLLFCFNGKILYAQGTANQDTTVKKTADSATLTNVEVESEFPGGAPAWKRFLVQNLGYPDKAVRKNIQGTVVLQFIVDKEGNVTDMKALSGPEILQEAALKAMKNTPKWKPAMQYGKRVKSYKKQPIIFRF